MDFDGALTQDLEHLLQRLGRYRLASFDRAWAIMAQEHFPEQDLVRPRHVDISRESLQVAIDNLEHRLSELDLDLTSVDKQAEGTLAGEFEVFAPIRVLRGYVVPIRGVPIPLKISARLMAFISIAGDKDVLDRHLDQGIHYHYALANGTHTTTMICWDSRWNYDLAKQPPAVTRPLFHELHGKGAKRKKARPELWGGKKRETIWKACSPDLCKWPIDEFRCASNKATAVWPINARLTPMSTRLSPSRK
jgi:hypothetical protein